MAERPALSTGRGPNGPSRKQIRRRRLVALTASIGAVTTLWLMALLGALASFSILFTPLWHVRDFPPGAPIGLEPPLADMPRS